MIKRITLVTAFLVLVSGFSFAGGKGGTELALASYGNVGVTVARGIPLNIEFLSSNGIATYGEFEFGAGFGSDVVFGAELAGGFLIGIDSGLSFYASFGPALGMNDKVDFGLGAEIGLNIDVNDSSIIVEAGSHPAASYFAVGMRF